MKHQLIMPSSLDHLRNTIIEKLMAISDKEYLMALNKLLENVTETESDKEELPKHVIEGIERGQADFEAGRYITFDAFKKKLSAK